MDHPLPPCPHRQQGRRAPPTTRKQQGSTPGPMPRHARHPSLRTHPEPHRAHPARPASLSAHIGAHRCTPQPTHAPTQPCIHPHTAHCIPHPHGTLPQSDPVTRPIPAHTPNMPTRSPMAHNTPHAHPDVANASHNRSPRRGLGSGTSSTATPTLDQVA